MITKKISVLVAGWLFLSAMASVAAERIQVDGYAAIAGSRVITIGEVMEILQAAEPELRTAASEAEYQRMFKQFYIEARDSLISQALIIEEFERIENAMIPDHAIDQRIQAIIEERYGGDRVAMLHDLREARLTMAQYRQQHHDAMAVMLMRQQELSGRVVISPGAMKDYYRDNIAQYSEPGQANVRMIVLDGAPSDDIPDPQALANHIHEKIADGGDFQEMAKEHSIDGRAADGGDWGWVNLHDYRAEIRDLLSSLSPGEISEPVIIGSRIYLAQLIDYREEQVTPFAEVETQIRRLLERKEETERQQAWINRLRDNHYVKLFDPPQLF